MSTRRETPDVLGKILEGAPVRKVEEIPFTQVRINGGTQMRAKLDQRTVSEYADEMRRGTIFPPVELFYDGETYWLGDGFHRYAAHREAHGSQTTIRAYVTPGTRRDAVLMAAGANADHGLRRTAADKARSVDALLSDEEWGKWSDREIGRRCHVTHRFVAKRRALLVKAGKVTPVTERKYMHKHGGTTTMKRGRPAVVTGFVSSDNQSGEHVGTAQTSAATPAVDAAESPGTAHSSLQNQPRLEPSTALRPGISQLPDDELPTDLVALGWEMRSMIGGSIYGVRQSHFPTRSTPVCQDMESMTALEQVIRAAREIEERTDNESVALDTGLMFSTVLVELRSVTANVLVAWLVNHETDGLPGLPATEVGEIRAACMDALGDTSSWLSTSGEREHAQPR